MTLYTKRDGIPFTIDPENYIRVVAYTWHFQRYIRTTIKGKVIRLHNFLFGKATQGLEWDHIDIDVLNNCRSNLRLVSHSMQMRNKRTPKNNTSGYKGVCWHVRHARWIAQIKLNGTVKHLGYFDSLEQAAQARRTAEGFYKTNTTSAREIL